MKDYSKYQITTSENKALSMNLLKDIRHLIESARQSVAITVNAGLTILYWQIGRRIRRDILKGKRTKYGEEILPTVSAKLFFDFGNGFSTRNLSKMIRFSEIFPNKEIVVSLTRHLSWSHFIVYQVPGTCEVPGTF